MDESCIAGRLQMPTVDQGPSNRLGPLENLRPGIDSLLLVLFERAKTLESFEIDGAAGNSLELPKGRCSRSGAGCLVTGISYSVESRLTLVISQILTLGAAI